MYVKELKKMGKTTVNLKIFSGGQPPDPHHSAFLKSCGEHWCELSAIQEGRNWGANFGQEKVQNSSPIPKMQIFGKEKCKTQRQFQRY